MKKLIFVLVVLFAVLASGCTKKPKDFVYLGQLYGTFGGGTQEKIKGKVKEFKQTHFWASEENGKVVKGKVITIEDRKTTPLGNDMTEEYNESGTVLRYTSYDENGKVVMDVKTNANGKILLGSEYYTNDTLRVNGEYKYDGNNLVEVIAYYPGKDSVYMSIKYEYDAGGNLIKTQTFNSKGVLTGYAERTRNKDGQEILVKNFDKNGKQTSQYDYTYNNKGERIGHHQQDFTIERVIDYTFKYEYDKMGNYTAIIFYKDGKPFIYRAREYKYYD